MAIGISSFETIYQTYYPDADLPYLTPKDAVLLNMFLGGSTDGQVSGDVVDMPWLLGAAPGVSQTYVTAANLSNLAPTAVRPQVRMSQVYKNLSFLDKDQILSQGEAAYGELMETTIKGSRQDFLCSLDELLHGNATGNRVAFAWASATPTVLALVPAPATLAGDTAGTRQLGAGVGQTFFEVGDQIVINSTNPADGTLAVTISGPYSVTAVDGNKNTVTISASPAADLINLSVYAIAIAGDVLGFNSALLLPGLIGVGNYNPYGGVGVTDNFLGVNRSIYGTRAAGTYFDATSGYSIEQGLRKGATQMKNTGLEAGGVTSCMHPDDYDTLDFKLTSQNRYGSHQLGQVFFDSIAISSTMGRMDTVVDVRQAKGQTRLYAPNPIELMYRNGLPHFATLRSGLDEQWGTNYDGREMRMRAYVQTRCRDPRKLSIVALPVSI
jgi:hypothetical protein